MKLKEQPIATLTIHGTSRMTPRGRRIIAEWLQNQADQIQDLGAKYSNKFTAKYFKRKDS